MFGVFGLRGGRLLTEGGRYRRLPRAVARALLAVVVRRIFVAALGVLAVGRVLRCRHLAGAGFGYGDLCRRRVEVHRPAHGLSPGNSSSGIVTALVLRLMLPACLREQLGVSRLPRWIRTFQVFMFVPCSRRPPPAGQPRPCAIAATFGRFAAAIGYPGHAGEQARKPPGPQRNHCAASSGHAPPTDRPPAARVRPRPGSRQAQLGRFRHAFPL